MFKYIRTYKISYTCTHTCVHLSNTSTITHQTNLQENHGISSKKTIQLHSIPNSPTFLGGDSLGDSSMTDGCAWRTTGRCLWRVVVALQGGVEAMSRRWCLGMAVKATPLAKLGSLFTSEVGTIERICSNERWGRGEQKWGDNNGGGRGCGLTQGFWGKKLQSLGVLFKIGWLL